MKKATLFILLLFFAGAVWAQMPMVKDAHVTEWFKRKMVVEEGTGTWCPWCVRGYVGMEYMRVNYPESFIGIAYHVSDQMSDESIDGPSYSTYPSMLVNRGTLSSVTKENFLYYYRNGAAGESDAMVRIDGIEESADGNTMKISTTTRFGRSMSAADYRLIYVVTEDGVGPYFLRNAYGEGDYGEMDGFEKEPAYVNLIFNDVARAVYPNINGLEGSVPSDIVASTDYAYITELKIPTNIDNLENAFLNVLLFDLSRGEIVNADRKQMPVLAFDEEFTIDVANPGTLSALVGNNAPHCKTLHLSGYLNGDDIAFLRKLAGLGKKPDEESEYKVLQTLDMEGVEIVSGGSMYYSTGTSIWDRYYTSDGEVGDYMFSDSKTLKKVILPSAVTTIGLFAFSGCTSLREVILGEDVMTIGYGAFMDCEAIEAIELPASVSSIDIYAFSGCRSLKTLHFPKGVKFENGNPATGTLGISAFTIDPDNPYYVEKDGVLYTSDYSELVAVPGGYKGMYTLGAESKTPGRVLELDSRCNKIGEEAMAFQGTVDVLIAQSVERLGRYALNYCSAKYFFFGPDLSDIDEYAISYISLNRNGSVVFIPAVRPPFVIGSMSFWNNGVTSTLYVPRESVSRYKSASVWRDFGNILPIEDSGFEVPANTGITNPESDISCSRVYTINGIQVDSSQPLPDGLYIVNGKKTLIRK